MNKRELLAIFVFALDRDLIDGVKFNSVLDFYLEKKKEYETINAEKTEVAMGIVSYADQTIIDAAEMITRFGDSYGKFDELIIKEFNKIVREQ